MICARDLYLAGTADVFDRCRALCRKLGVPLTVAKVVVPREASLEAAARKTRYAVYARLRADFIVLAHNADDQAETLLLQLLRGTGVKGGSGRIAGNISWNGAPIALAGFAVMFVSGALLFDRGGGGPFGERLPTRLQIVCDSRRRV